MFLYHEQLSDLLAQILHPKSLYKYTSSMTIWIIIFKVLSEELLMATKDWIESEESSCGVQLKNQ